MIGMTGCSISKETASLKGAIPTDGQREANNNKIDEINYQKDGIKATYPKIISDSTDVKRSKWNQIIEAEFQKILQIYAFNPFPELTPRPTGSTPTILSIKDTVKLNNENYLSVVYLADFNFPYAAHPTDIIYSTTIDKKKDERARLSDLVELNQEFVKDFRKWDFIPIEEGNQELNAAIKEYMLQMSDEDLLLGFQAADQINSKNLWGVYSYLTPDRLGISISVPNYIGDHVEFEREYSQITKFLKSNTN
jgi:hypothetical protein